jgi:predicted phage-related endonuclease
VLQFGQITVALDGTKVLANASKHSAVSYERAGQMIAQLELEVKQFIAKAEPPPPAAGASVSEAMKHRLATMVGKQKYKLRQQTGNRSWGLSKACWDFGSSGGVDGRRQNWNGLW